MSPSHPENAAWRLTSQGGAHIPTVKHRDLTTLVRRGFAHQARLRAAQIALSEIAHIAQREHYPRILRIACEALRPPQAQGAPAMFSMTIRNTNTAPVLVAFGHLALDLQDHALDPSGVKTVTLTAMESGTVVCDADTDRIYAQRVPMRGEEPPQAATFELTNPNTSAVRVEYGDAATGELAELDLEPGEALAITALASWRVGLSLLGVTGEHEPPNDGFTEGGG